MSKTARQLRNAEALKAFREQIIYRSQGLCEANTPACPDGPHRGAHCHHRSISERRVGLHNPDHGLYCCEPAHRHIHANPAESYSRGWLLRATS